MTGVLVKREFSPTLDVALRLHPDTTRVVFVGGTSEFDARLVEQARDEFRRYEDRLAFTYLTSLSLGDLLAAVANLPPHTIVLYSTMFRDGAGEAFVPHDVAERITAAAKVPVYGFLDQFLGTRHRRRSALQLATLTGNKPPRWHGKSWSGTQPSELPVEGGQCGGESVRLAATAAMGYQRRPIAAWQHGPVQADRRRGSMYRWQIVGAALLVVLQTALIATLLIQRARRQRTRTGAAEERATLRPGDGRRRGRRVGLELRDQRDLRRSDPEGDPGIRRRRRSSTRPDDWGSQSPSRRPCRRLRPRIQACIDGTSATPTRSNIACCTRTAACAGSCRADR